MTGSVECRYHGRDFTADEMALLRALIAGPPALNRHALSKEFCRRIGWYKADGGLKDMMARVVMLAMHKDGRIELPPPKWPRPPRRPTTFGPDTEPPLPLPPDTLQAVRPLSLRPIVGYSREGKLWNEYVARYHYLGYTTLVGAQMRYAVHAHDGTPLAMLGFSTAAWTLAPRDRFIGWSRQMREKNLPLVVDNPRFLILPWVHIPNLGSHILALVRQRLPGDWTAATSVSRYAMLTTIAERESCYQSQKLPVTTRPNAYRHRNWNFTAWGGATWWAFSTAARSRATPAGSCCGRWSGARTSWGGWPGASRIIAGRNGSSIRWSGW